MYLHSTCIIFLWPPLFLLRWAIHQNNQHLLDRDCLRLCRRRSTEGTPFCISVFSTKPCCDLEEISMYIDLIYLYHVYTCIYRYIPGTSKYILGTYSHMRCHTTYIILYTLYMSMYAVYIIYLNITVPAFFNSQALSGHISSCQQVSSHKLCKYIAIIQLLLNQYKPVHPFQTKV
jgi:hypothetical protein